MSHCGPIWPDQPGPTTAQIPLRSETRCNMNRNRSIERLAEAGASWDILVIGGGATGLGVALDAASRGYRTALVEQHDFAKGTSSRSTKLAHGGVRYLRSGEIGLVRSALQERGLLERNAPHLVRRRAFVIPLYRRLDVPFYGLGLKAYEWLSGSLSFGASRILSAAETRRLLPTVQDRNLRGGVLYYDGQFDDARLALMIARTADEQGAVVANYARVHKLLKENDRICGAEVIDEESNRVMTIRARVVVNATGIFTDEIRRLDEPNVQAMLAVSSGVHLTLDRSFLPGDHALMIPKTSDGRVLFAVPWQGHVILGTTDESRPAPELEPRPLEREVRFLLDHAAEYLTKPVSPADVLSVFTGLRPLVQQGNAAATKSLSRDHVITTSPSGLVTITGGKWTSYRKMAEDTVDYVAKEAGLPPTTSGTRSLALHGAGLDVSGRLSHYGTDAAELERLIAVDPMLSQELHPRFDISAAEIVWAARHEMARTVDDVLSRRTRMLQLDARAAIEAAPHAARILAQTLQRDEQWITRQVEEFTLMARHYLPQPDTVIAPAEGSTILRIIDASNAATGVERH